MREAIFRAVGATSGRMPRMRGKNRLALGLLKLLGLKGKHVFVDAQLRAPVAYRARLDMHSWLQRLAFVSGEYEAETVQMLARLRQSSSGYLLDIGANIGLISVPFSMLTGSQVIALEAIPDNARALMRHIAMNDAQGRVRVIQLAVGDVPVTSTSRSRGT